MKNLVKTMKATVLVAMAGLSLFSCRKDDDATEETVESPKVEFAVLGESNSKTVYAGENLHVEAKIIAVNPVKDVQVEIKSQEKGTAVVTKNYSEKYAGKLVADFREDIQIKDDTKAGKYDVAVKVTDSKGNIAEVKDVVSVEENLKPQWSKVEFRFIEGHAHGSTFHGNPEFPGVQYLKSIQRFFFEYKDGKLVPSANNPKSIRLIGDGLKGQAMEGLEIIYYNEKGERVKTYSERAAAQQFQHFFIAEDLTNNVNTVGALPAAGDIFTYTYRDTNPEDLYFKVPSGSTAQTSVLRSEKIGLKGYFFLNKSYVNFNLRVILGRFDKKADNLNFNSIPDRKVMDVKIPIHIYFDLQNAGDEERFYEEAAKEYGVTADDIEEDVDTKISSPVDAESSVFYL